MGKFFAEYFTSLTLDVHTGVVSTEDIVEIWEPVREEAIVKVRGNKNRSTRTDSSMVDEAEVLSFLSSNDLMEPAETGTS
jgi:hypothetical protein